MRAQDATVNSAVPLLSSKGRGVWTSIKPVFGAIKADFISPFVLVCAPNGNVVLMRFGRAAFTNYSGHDPARLAVPFNTAC